MYNRLSQHTREQALHVDALMNGKQQKCFIDTGADITLVPESLVKGGVSQGGEVDLRGVLQSFIGRQ